MKRQLTKLSISWNKKPNKQIFIKQLNAIIDGYIKAAATHNNYKNSNQSILFISFSDSAKTFLEKINQRENSANKTINLIQQLCGIPIRISKRRNYCIELKKEIDDGITIEQINEWDCEFKKALSENKKSLNAADKIKRI